MKHCTDKELETLIDAARAAAHLHGDIYYKRIALKNALRPFDEADRYTELAKWDAEHWHDAPFGTLNIDDPDDLYAWTGMLRQLIDKAVELGIVTKVGAS